MNNNMFESINCNLCGSDRTITIYVSSRDSNNASKEHEFRSSGDEPLVDPLVKCADCGFIYVSPRINSHVVMDSYINAVDETFVSQSKGRERTFERCLKIVQKVWGNKPSRLLDVGTANGSFLKVAKGAGWQVCGCEPNKWMCNWCNDNYGINVHCGTIFDAGYENSFFDVITLWDVLEHTPDPSATLKECVRILRPGGLLVINYPDIGSIIAKLMGKKWVFLLSVHYFYFNKNTIREAMRKAGLHIEKIKPHFQSLEFDYILFRAIPYLGPAAKMLRLIVNKIGLAKMQIPYWMGQTLVIARKQ